MNKYLAGYAAIAVLMLTLDALWLGLVAKAAYQSGIGHLMAEKPDLVAAGLFYLLFPAGLVIFVLAPQAQDTDWARTVLMGALFGFFAYATYDLSNLATLRDWPLRLSLLDLAWGTVISATCAVAGKAAMNAVAAG
jgi:uncharacterized membrane protein